VVPFQAPRDNCEHLGSGRVRVVLDKQREPAPPEYSTLAGPRSSGITSTYFDGAGRRPDFRKALTRLREILGTISRLTASLAISRAESWEFGRSEAASRSSQDSATLAACCSAENVGVLPLRGWSESSVSISLLSTDFRSLHSTSMSRSQAVFQRFRQTLTSCVSRQSQITHTLRSPISNLLQEPKPPKTWEQQK
jgi:hypothetical protein